MSGLLKMFSKQPTPAQIKEEQIKNKARFEISKKKIKQDFDNGVKKLEKLKNEQIKKAEASSSNPRDELVYRRLVKAIENYQRTLKFRQSKMDFYFTQVEMRDIMFSVAGSPLLQIFDELSKITGQMNIPDASMAGENAEVNFKVMDSRIEEFFASIDTALGIDESYDEIANPIGDELSDEEKEELEKLRGESVSIVSPAKVRQEKETREEETRLEKMKQQKEKIYD
jgi:hypothetical protein